MTKSGYKEISKENYLLADPVMSVFCVVEPDGTTRTQTIDEWFEDIHSLKISEDLPEELKRLMSVAQGSMIYGYFYYPLFTLGAEQFTRIADTAIKIKCESLNYPKNIKSFRYRVGWLFEQGEFTEAEKNHWLGTVILRNKLAHPKDQWAITPAMAINLMKNLYMKIEKLFQG